MAVAYDGFSESSIANGGSSTTFSHSCGGTDRLLVVFVAMINDGLETSTSVTFDGTNLTSHGVYNRDDDAYVRMWYMTNPPTGSKNVVANVDSLDDPASGAVVWAVSFTGVDQTTPLDSILQNNEDDEGTTLYARVSGSTETGDMVVGCFAGENSGVVSSITGGTSIDGAYEPDCVSYVAYGTDSTTVTITWNMPGGHWASVGANINASSGSTTESVSMSLDVIPSVSESGGATAGGGITLDQVSAMSDGRTMQTTQQISLQDIMALTGSSLATGSAQISLGSDLGLLQTKLATVQSVISMSSAYGKTNESIAGALATLNVLQTLGLADSGISQSGSNITFTNNFGISIDRGVRQLAQFILDATAVIGANPLVTNLVSMDLNLTANQQLDGIGLGQAAINLASYLGLDTDRIATILTETLLDTLFAGSFITTGDQSGIFDLGIVPSIVPSGTGLAVSDSTFNFLTGITKSGRGTGRTSLIWDAILGMSSTGGLLGTADIALDIQSSTTAAADVYASATITLSVATDLVGLAEAVTNAGMTLASVMTYLTSYFMVVVTPDNRIFYIMADSRNFTLTGQLRQFVITSDLRSLIIDNESRTLTVPNEDNNYET